MTAAGDMMPDARSGSDGDPAALPRAHLLLNALALRTAGDASRFFLENLIRHFPSVWPAARLTVVVREGVEVPGEIETVRIRLRGDGIGRVVEELVRLPRLVERVAPDVVVNPNESVPTRIAIPTVVFAQNLLFHCRNVGPLPTGPVAARLKSRLQFAFYRRQMPRAYHRADAVVAVSAHAADALRVRAGLDPRKVTVAPCGADRLPVRPRIQVGGPRRIVVVGALAHYKRLDVAVRALGLLRASGGDYELVLAGEEWPGYAAVLDDVARAAGVADHVRRLGPLADEALADLLATGQLTLSLSRCESFGIPVVEAMRAGLPAIVADEPWSRDLVGDAALRVEPDAAAVEAAIRSLEDPKEWRRRSDAGRDVAALYTWRRTAAGIAAAAARVVRMGRAG